MRHRLIGTLLLAGALLAPFISTPTALAVTGSDWKAGRIIDDEVFYNSGAMSVSQIQNFLQSKVTCDRNGTKTSEYGGGTRAQYGASRGYPAPYTCLLDYHENIVTKQNNLEGRPIPSEAKSAAQIIWEAGQRYSINPQALIVLLQKEQGLVTDEWPFPVQYRSATGYGCPDTAACDSAYYGFYNQVENAAKQFKRYKDNPTSYNHWPNTNNNIRWSPNASCGSGSVHIHGSATAGLYNYTPYQPNQAALNNLYGTGDGCSAYGNRNFWRLFNDWFGGTLVSFAWKNQGYQVFNQAETLRFDPGNLRPGQLYVAKVAAINIGSASWTKDGPTPFTLATTSPDNRESPLCHASWLNCHRPAYLSEAKVAPGELGHFKFIFRTPTNAGTYREYFRPLAENLSWANHSEEALGIVVRPDTYFMQEHGYRVMDKDETTYLDPGQLLPGETYVGKFSTLNVGTATWKNTLPNPMTLAPDKPAGHNSPYCHASWLSCHRVSYMQEESVEQGQTANFKFIFKAPYVLGNHRIYFRPVAEMVSWVEGPESSLGIEVKSPGTFTWDNLGYSVMDENETTTVDPFQLQRGQRYTVRLSAKNTGTATWKNNGPIPITLATARPQSHNSYLCFNTWLNCNRLAYLQETSIAPGQTGTFKFKLQAPNSPGVYGEYFKPVAEFHAWFPDSTPFEMIVR